MSCEAKTSKLFYYEIDQFFNISTNETNYRTENTLDKKGKSILDDYAININDRPLYEKFLKRAASDVAVILQPMNKDLDNAFGYNSNPSLTVEEINDLETPEENLLILVSDSGTLTLGSLVVAVGDKVYYNGSIYVEDNSSTVKYIYYFLDFPEETYNFNNIIPFDEKLYEYIIMFIVYEWFKRHKLDLAVIKPEYDEIRMELKRFVNYRKKTTRPVRTF